MKQETGRLKEILHVLKEHKVTQGIDPVKLCRRSWADVCKAWTDYVNAFRYTARALL